MIQLAEDDIILSLKAGNKEGVLQELADLLHKHCADIDLELLHRVLREREQIGSTGVGNGVAIPHGKIEGLDHILLGFGRSTGGIHFDSIDNQPVSLVVMILSPLAETNDYLKTLAQVSRLLKQPDNRRALRLASNTQQVASIFNEEA